ncbi:U8 snoRNA-decapping enzyme, partial [Stegodyphus mimosarum]
MTANVSTVINCNSQFKYITFHDALKFTDYRHVAHCCIYAHSPDTYFLDYEIKTLVSMQLRFDGCMGFPGGIIEEGTNIVSGLNRELEEEINLNSKYFITDENHLFSHVNFEAKTCYHFYGKEVSKEEFQCIEKNALDARDYGIETFGMIRVPLFTMQDGIRGFPTFLTNCFIA